MTRQTKRQKNNNGLMKLRSIDPKTRNQEAAFDANDRIDNIMMLGLPGTR